MRTRSLSTLLATTALLALASTAAAGPRALGPVDGRPDALIDLGTAEGTALVQGQWRYSDTQIIETDFRAPGPDLKGSGAPVKTYDFAPHAGGPDFDDSTWSVIAPNVLDGRRSNGRLAFN